LAVTQSQQSKPMHLSDILTHLGEDREQYFNAVSPPVIQSSNFVFDSIADFRRKFANESAHHIYTRGNNPTVKILRQKIAALESAEDALVVDLSFALRKKHTIDTSVHQHTNTSAHPPLVTFYLILIFLKFYYIFFFFRTFILPK